MGEECTLEGMYNPGGLLGSSWGGGAILKEARANKPISNWSPTSAIYTKKSYLIYLVYLFMYIYVLFGYQKTDRIHQGVWEKHLL